MRDGSVVKNIYCYCWVSGGSIPSTQMAVHKCHNSSSRGFDDFLKTLWAMSTHVVHKHKQSIHIHKSKKNFFNLYSTQQFSPMNELEVSLQNKLCISLLHINLHPTSNSKCEKAKRLGLRKSSAWPGLWQGSWACACLGMDLQVAAGVLMGNLPENFQNQ